MPRHPNKHIQAAIKYAEEHDWRVVKAGGQAHIWGKQYCPANSEVVASFASTRHRESPNTTPAIFVKKLMTVLIQVPRRQVSL
jgi:hypothetical protein